MYTKDYIIRAAKKVYRVLSGKKFYAPECDCDRQSSNNRIFSLLSTGEPCMIARFGTIEINCINNYLTVHSENPFWTKVWNYISDQTHTPWWNTDHFKAMCINAGVFPISQETAERFSERYLADIPEIDLLACHQYYEKFMPLRQDVVRVQLEMLYPFFVERPWTRVLKGKKVLVVHPFVDTIRKQYEKRESLFENPDILPDFELITLKAVQSIGGAGTEFKSWFDALAYMEAQIAKIDFDIAIIGCGAYGLPLAASIKRLGKQAVHMGGATQLLFGILGKRWTEDYPEVWHYRPGVDIQMDYRTLFNDSWCYPDESERPQNFKKVENGCYW